MWCSLMCRQTVRYTDKKVFTKKATFYPNSRKIAKMRENTKFCRVSFSVRSNIIFVVFSVKSRKKVLISHY